VDDQDDRPLALIEGADIGAVGEIAVIIATPPWQPHLPSRAEPVNWDVTASAVTPSQSLTCMILAGSKTGQPFRCTPLERKSVPGYWARGQQITGD
jgi:hypothetical protein